MLSSNELLGRRQLRCAAMQGRREEEEEIRSTEGRGAGEEHMIDWLASPGPKLLITMKRVNCSAITF